MQISLPANSAQNRPPAQNVTLAQIHNAKLQTISNPNVAQNSNQNPNPARNAVPAPNPNQNQTLGQVDNQNRNPSQSSAPIPNLTSAAVVAQNAVSSSNVAGNPLVNCVPSAAS